MIGSAHRDGDELLVLNGTCMIDVPHDDLLSTFCSLLNGNSSRDLMVVSCLEIFRLGMYCIEFGLHLDGSQTCQLG